MIESIHVHMELGVLPIVLLDKEVGILPEVLHIHLVRVLSTLLEVLLHMEVGVPSTLLYTWK